MRPLAYNSLIIGREKKSRWTGGDRIEIDGASRREGVEGEEENKKKEGNEDGNESDGGTTRNDEGTQKVEGGDNNQTNEERAGHIAPPRPLTHKITEKSVRGVTAARSGHGNGPSCRLFKVDLTGNFFRCQAAAVGTRSVFNCV